MEGLTEQQQLDYQKAELINDLLAVQTVIEEVWKYHPNNPNQVYVVDEYASLQQMKDQIEQELAELDK